MKTLLKQSGTTYEPILAPFKYPWAWEMYQNGQNNHWTWVDTPMQGDIADYNALSDAERHLFIHNLSYLTSADLFALSTAGDRLGSMVNAPELSLFLSLHAAQEGVHSVTYQHCIEVLSLLDQGIYTKYKTVDSIGKKISIIDEYTKTQDISSSFSIKDFLHAYFVFSGLFEGVLFYNGFTPIFSLKRQNKMNATAQQLEYIARDECLIEGSEVLTPNGWVNIEDVSMSTKIAQWHEDGGITFTTPIKLSSTEVDEYYLFSNQQGHISQAVSANHRVPYLTKKGNLKVVKAKDATPNPYSKHPLNGHLDGDDSVVLTAHERFLIALQADGSIADKSLRNGKYTGCNAVIFSFKKTRKINRLVDILMDTGFEYTKSEIDKKGYTKFYVKAPLGMAFKSFNEWIDLEGKSAEWCRSFIEELSHWGGHRVSGGENRIAWSSTNKTDADTVQAIASLCGIRCNYALVEDDRSDTFNDIHRIHLIKDRSHLSGGAINKTLIKESARVYGIEVPSTFIVMRHNNAVSITGNSLHVAFGIRFINEAMSGYNINGLDDDYLHCIAMDVIEIEEQYIQMLVSKGDVFGYVPEDHLSHSKYLIDRNLKRVGVKPCFDQKTPTLLWLDEVVHMKKEKNFFENRPQEYSVGANLNFSSNVKMPIGVGKSNA